MEDVQMVFHLIFIPLLTLEFKKELNGSQRDFSKYSIIFIIFR